MTLFIDLILIGVFVGFTVAGYRKGFVKMLISCFKNLAAFLIAFFTAPKLGEIIAKMSFMDNVRVTVAEKLTTLLGTDSATAEDVKRIINSEQNAFAEFAERMGVDTNAVSKVAENAVGNVNEAVGEYIAEPCVSVLSCVIAFVIVFVVSVLAIKLVGVVLSLIVKLPVLHASNKILGIVTGALLGLFWVFIITAVIRTASPFFADNIMVATLESTGSLYSRIASFSPDFLSKLL